MKHTGWVGRFGAAMLLAASLALAGCAEKVTRDEFSSHVMHKSEREVAKRFGKPAQVEEGPDGVKWIYTGKTLNVKDDGWDLDPKTVVVFVKASPDGTATATEVLYE